MNVDDNRVFLSGISDGGAGAYYFAMQDPTPFAAFFVLIAHPLVLLNEKDVAGRPALVNLVNSPIYIVNTGRDPLYPAAAMRPFLDAFDAMGVQYRFSSHRRHGHDLGWLARERPRMDEFRAASRRDPLPDRVVWQTATPALSGRMRWLVVDELMPQASSGRVVLEKSANRVNVRASGVLKMRLLVSPEHFDLERPLQIDLNGSPISYSVRPSVATLQKWHALDMDRTMLFAAEVRLTLDATAVRSTEPRGGAESRREPLQ